LDNLGDHKQGFEHYGGQYKELGYNLQKVEGLSTMLKWSKP